MSLGSRRLRLESGNGSPAKEYRIEDGNVEVRALDLEGGSVRYTGSVWWRLTSEQLSNHVERNTFLAAKPYKILDSEHTKKPRTH